MGPYLDSILEVLVDRPPQEWIGGLMVALFLALALAGAHTALRRWTKVPEDTTPLVGLAIVFIFAAMILASVSSELKFKRPAEPAGDSTERSSGGPGRGPRFGSGSGRGGFFTSRMADRIFENADDDHDGRLSSEEAASAAGKFIEAAEKDNDGESTLDRDALVELIRENMRSPESPPPPPPSPDPEPASAPPS